MLSLALSLMLGLVLVLLLIMLLTMRLLLIRTLIRIILSLRVMILSHPAFRRNRPPPLPLSRSRSGSSRSSRSYHSPGIRMILLRRKRHRVTIPMPRGCPAHKRSLLHTRVGVDTVTVPHTRLAGVPLRRCSGCLVGVVGFEGSFFGGWAVVCAATTAEGAGCRGG